MGIPNLNHWNALAHEPVDAEVGVEEDPGRNDELEESFKDGVVAKFPVIGKLLVEGRESLQKKKLECNKMSFSFYG